MVLLVPYVPYVLCDKKDVRDIKDVRDESQLLRVRRCWLARLFRPGVERGLFAARDDAIMNTHKFEDGSCPGIAKPWLGQTKDSSVTAFSISEPGRNVTEKNLHRLFVAKHA